MFSEDQLVRLYKTRGKIFFNIVLGLFGILLGRLWYLQMLKGSELNAFSVRNGLRQEQLRPLRGLIFSRDGKLLTKNSPRFDAVAIPQYLPKNKEILKKLSKTLSLSEEEIEKTLKKFLGAQAAYRPITLKKNISSEELALIETQGQELPGIQVRTFIGREYALESVTSHFYGHLSEISKEQLPKYIEKWEKKYSQGDLVGQTGIELQYENYLQGESGHELVEVDALGRMRRFVSDSSLFEGMSNLPAINGSHLLTTLDYDLQEKAVSLLEGKEGAIVALEVKTGDVLVYASSPGFKAEDFSHGISSKDWETLIKNPKKPLIDRVIQSHYSPGSTFKLITAMAGLESKAITKDTYVNCPGYFNLGSRTFNCWKKNGHGNMNVVSAIRESCNVFFYKLATRLDIDTIAHYAFSFGLGNKSGINLPREISGLIPTTQWKKINRKEEWHLGETLSCAIGQSYVLATPLQLALFTSGIANNGLIFKPRLVQKVFGQKGEIIKEIPTEVLKQTTLSPETLQLLQQGLREVVNLPSGTAYAQRGEGIHMAGKTGTSQNMSMSKEKLFAKCDQKEYHLRHHGLFIGLAPYDAPKIALAIVIEHGCGGSKAAAPLAKEIVTSYLQKYFPEEHELKKQQDKQTRPKAPPVIRPVLVNETEEEE